MRNFLLILLIVIQLLACNTSAKKTDKESVVPEEEILNKSIQQKYYVSAVSGLNYRDTPKGTVLGKFLFNTAVEVVLHSKVFQVIEDNGKKVQGEWVGVKKNKDTVYVFNAFLSKVKGVNNNNIWTYFPIKKTPIIDSTNFDNLKKEKALNLHEIETLQLERIYPNLKKEGYSYQFIPSYKLKISEEFKTIVVCVYKGDHELESVLINYNLDDKLIDYKQIAYDEIAEGWSRETSTITKEYIQNINALYTDTPQIDTTYYTFNELGFIKKYKLKKEPKIVYSSADKIEFLKDSLSLIYTLSCKDNSELKFWTNEKESSSNSFFLTDYKNMIFLSKEIEGSITVKMDTLLSNEYTSVEIHKDNFASKEFNNQNYFLFSLREKVMGTAVLEHSIRFFMLNKNSLKLHELNYTGEYTLRTKLLDGEFENNIALNKYPLIKNILKEYASKSKLIYIPTEEEKDSNNYINFVQKWYEDNNVNNNLATGYGYKPDKVYSTYYKRNIFKVAGDYGADYIENDRFKIVNFSYGSVLGYDKVKELYFPVFVESCNSGCLKEIRFVDGNTVEITHDFLDKNSFTININEINFTNK